VRLRQRISLLFQATAKAANEDYHDCQSYSDCQNQVEKLVLPERLLFESVVDRKVAFNITIRFYGQKDLVWISSHYHFPLTRLSL
jgi:hypothetical protein